MTLLAQPVTVGSLELPNRVFLAPLAGVSDVPFRLICRELGAGLTFVEMLNANSVIHCNRKSNRILSRHPDETILGIQVTGSRPEAVGTAVEYLDQMGFDLIDINMGCPVRKIVARGSGSALLQDPERIANTVTAARAATRNPLSVKVRLGFTRENINILETSEIIASRGVDMFTIHGRARTERYGVPVDRKGIRSGLDKARAISSKLITVGNGDVLDRESAEAMIDQTHCDAVMISRGALGNPWIFAQILDPDRGEPTVTEWLDVVLRHLDHHQNFYGDDPYCVVLTRKHLLWYANGFPNVRRFRDKLSIVKSLDEARSMLREYAKGIPPDLRRYEAMDTRERGDLAGIR